MVPEMAYLWKIFRKTLYLSENWPFFVENIPQNHDEQRMVKTI